MPDEPEGEEQDIAETFDETHREGEDPNLYDVEDELDPDLDSRAYDAVSARGDEGEGEDEEDLDDLDDEDLEDFDEEEEEDENEDEDLETSRGEGLAADQAEDMVDSDERADIVALADEPELTLAEDLDTAAPTRNRQADKFESNGPLSDEQIAELGYDDDDARLDESLEETFPASDSPAARKPI
jgi:ribonuclease E